MLSVVHIHIYETHDLNQTTVYFIAIMSTMFFVIKRQKLNV